MTTKRTAIEVPENSPFVTAKNRLTPAWHYYLANIEKLVDNISVNFDGQVLLDIEARLTVLEAKIAYAEEQLPKRNWGFYHTTSALTYEETDPPIGHCQVGHALNTTRVIGRCHTRDSGDLYNCQLQEFNTGNILGLGPSIHMKDGVSEAWVLGFYDTLQ